MCNCRMATSFCALYAPLRCAFPSTWHSRDCPAQQTDGLGDNIHPQELLLLLDQVKTLTPPPSPEPGQTSSAGSHAPDLATTYADALLRYGRICMGSMTKESPFQLAAAKEGLDFRGGKVDECVHPLHHWRRKAFDGQLTSLTYRQLHRCCHRGKSSMNEQSVDVCRRHASISLKHVEYQATAFARPDLQARYLGKVI